MHAEATSLSGDSAGSPHDPATTVQGPRRWIPIRLQVDPENLRGAVRWVDFGSHAPVEPFFEQTIAALFAQKSPALRHSGFEALLSRARDLGPVPPAGLIFHISRCGSTLVANALRTSENATVIAEPQPFGALFRPDKWSRCSGAEDSWRSLRRSLALALSSIYAVSHSGTSQRLILKFGASAILAAQSIREIWPTTPSIVMVREPVEVYASNMRTPAQWMRHRSAPELLAQMLGSADPADTTMEPEEYCARVIGRYCESAAAIIDNSCRVVDYQDLNERSLNHIAAFFRLTLPSQNSGIVSRELTRYSKSVGSERSFQSDIRQKRDAVSPERRFMIDHWAAASYRRLREESRWLSR